VSLQTSKATLKRQPQGTSLLTSADQWLNAFKIVKKLQNYFKTLWHLCSRNGSYKIRSHLQIIHIHVNSIEKTLKSKINWKSSEELDHDRKHLVITEFRHKTRMTDLLLWSSAFESLPS